MSEVRPVAILGTGMAAFGAVHHLESRGVPSICYDKNAYFGGHTATFAHPSGFLFDDGPHVSFTRDERIQKLLVDGVQNQFEYVQMQVDNYWRGHRIKHPVQCNLYGLPSDLVTRIVVDFVEAQSATGATTTYEDWLYAAYGKTLAETFPMVYGLKYHTTTANNMTTEWLGPRMYRPTLQEVVEGALAPSVKNVHYVTHFRYPTYGGFESYLRSFATTNDLRLGHELVGLDPRSRRLRFANGLAVSYDVVISSIPLPELVRLVDGAPEDVLQAARKLAFTTAVVVNIGVNRRELSEAHLTYFYDPDVVFSRLNFPHMLSANNVPPGAGSIQAEIYFSDKYRPLSQSLDALVDRTIHDLRRCGVLTERDRILFREGRVVRYANVIYDLDRRAALTTVHGFLDDIGVYYCGRYGAWDHAWTDEAFQSGERAAIAALNGET
jgi:protoporphyrinogen oxidase